MKKFSSFAAMVVVAVSAVFGLTSCQQDDVFDNGGGIERPVPPTPSANPTSTDNASVDFEFFVSDEILNLGDYTLTVERPNHTTVLDMASGECETKTYTNTQYGITKTSTGKKVVIYGLERGSVVTPSFKAFEGAFDLLPKDGATDATIISDCVCHNVANSGFNISPTSFVKMMNGKVEGYIANQTKSMVFKF